MKEIVSPPGRRAFRAVFPPSHDGRPYPEFMSIDWTWRLPPHLMLELNVRGFDAIASDAGRHYFIGLTAQEIRRMQAVRAFRRVFGPPFPLPETPTERS